MGKMIHTQGWRAILTACTGNRSKKCRLTISLKLSTACYGLIHCTNWLNPVRLYLLLASYVDIHLTWPIRVKKWKHDTSNAPIQFTSADGGHDNLYVLLRTLSWLRSVIICSTRRSNQGGGSTILGVRPQPAWRFSKIDLRTNHLKTLPSCWPTLYLAFERPLAGFYW